ncbi:MAG: hypothetical protein KF708_17820 [Pirellulales bacterium]|nr:hypothetical protein [Pirellulales bacterium]
MSVASEPSSPPEKALFTPVLPAHLALRKKHVVLVAALAAFFLYLNYIPLWHTDLWSHVDYGRWILAHRELPTSEPFLPLAQGMRVVDSAWLSQVILAQIQQWGGDEWLSNSFAIVVFSTYLLFARSFFLETRRIALVLAGLLLLGAVGWSRLSTIRPEMFGALCFAILCWLLTRSRWGSRSSTEPIEQQRFDAPLWVGVPVLFILWANLHGSFVCGLILLGCYFLGQLILVAARTRSFAAVAGDTDVRQLLVLTEIATIATLLNPYGLDLLIYATGFMTNSNLRDVLEWTPLVLTGIGGWEFALSWVVLLAVWRHSRRPIHPREVLLLGVFGLAAIWQIRMLAWYAPVFALVVVPHLGEIADRRWPRTATPEPAPESATRSQWTYTLCCLVLVWIAFALSGLSRPLLGGAERTPEQLYSRYTPRGASAYLRANPPSGQVWNPQWWGDWLTWDGPPGLQPFVTTQLHMLPAEVWKNYIQIYNAQPGWQELLDRYRITTVVLDKERQPILTPVLRQSQDWIPRYEDETALILERKPAEQLPANPAPTAPAAQAAQSPARRAF